MGIGCILGMAYIGQYHIIFPYLSQSQCVLILICLMFLLMLYRYCKVRTIKALSCLWAAILTALLAFNYANHKLNQRLLLRESQPIDVEVWVYVKKIAQRNAITHQQKVEVLNRHTEPVQWLLYLDPQMPSLTLGQYYRLLGKVQPSHAYANLASFDVEQWDLQQNVMARLKVQQQRPMSSTEVLNLGYADFMQQQQHFWPRSLLWVEQQRLAIRQFIQQQHLSQQGLILALLTGDKSLLPQAITQQFQRLGLSHLLAISGPHVLLLAWMLCCCIHGLIRVYQTPIYLILPKPYLLLLPFLLALMLYSAYAGFEIPVLRTLLMWCGVSLTVLLKQAIHALAILISSAVILLLFDPLSILSAAFWLSYVACFILLLIYQRSSIKQVAVTHNIWQKICLYISELTQIQGKIFLALLPLVVIFFQQTTWMAPLSNVLFLPCLSLLIVPLNILAALAYLFFEPLSRLIFQLNDLLLSLLMAMMGGLDQLFQPQLWSVPWQEWQLCSLVLALCCLFIPQGVVPRFWAFLCLFPLCFAQQPHIPFELVVLDVGQGQAVFIRYLQQYMMIDMGGKRHEDQFGIGQQVVLPFLRRQHALDLDLLILSHLDQDHSGAYFAIQDQIRVKQLYANQHFTANTATQLCYAGQKISFAQGLSIEILSPQKADLDQAQYDKNEHSCVVYIQLKQAKNNQSFLIMGDAGWATEFKILQQYPQLKVDVLLLGHHGSQYSSAYDFLQRLNPKLAVISAGFNNRYQHPSIKTIRRLQQLNIAYLSTATSGSIHFKIYDDHMELEQYRSQRRWLNRDSH